MPVECATEEPFRAHSRQMKKLSDPCPKSVFNFWPGEHWNPNVNLYETDEFYVVCVDLSGVDKDKIDIVVQEQQLVLRGKREVPVLPIAEGKKVKVHLMEIDHGQFCREVELPCDVKREQIVATYQNGMLWIELPKK